MPPPPEKAITLPPKPKRRPRPVAPAPEPPKPVEEPPQDAPPAPPMVPVVAAPAPAPAAPPAPVVPPDLNAAYRNNPAPPYPQASRRMREEGTVVLNVLVSREGKPLAVRVARSSGFPRLDESALDSVRGWTFRPARQGEQAVESHVEVPIRFTLDS